MSFIEGVGDEVVLFCGFLALSFTFITFVSFWKRHRTPADPATAESAQREEHTQPRGEEDITSGHHQNVAGGDGVRSRFNPINPITPSLSTEEVASDQPNDDTESREVPDGGSEFKDGSVPINNEENRMRIRLIRAGGPGHSQEICVSPETTLDFIRR